ncbi:uncharacterized protein LOC116197873 [Punica granatum]|uniref:Uncharacterized protein n=2 Tax=Punica granatum TaxID=22663 RepID=A0A2I0K5B6_PUNGR|nr:uncharacterized protein LOC116197873 [Punica granatum]PKI63734.1 hypothetical protein CRG98_015855 [Punica granatum]
MRRRNGSGNVLSGEVSKYLSMRKSVQKAMKKAILGLKATKDNSAASPLGEDDEATVFVSLLREVEVATVAFFESVLCFISGTRQLWSKNSRSLISKVVLKERTSSEEGKADINEFAKQAAALESLISHKTSTVHDLMQVERLQNGLKNLSLLILDLEEGLESLYRMLIETRSLLNVCTN